MTGIFCVPYCGNTVGGEADTELRVITVSWPWPRRKSVTRRFRLRGFAEPATRFGESRRRSNPALSYPHSISVCVCPCARMGLLVFRMVLLDKILRRKWHEYFHCSSSLSFWGGSNSVSVCVCVCARTHTHDHVNLEIRQFIVAMYTIGMYTKTVS